MNIDTSNDDGNDHRMQQQEPRLGMSNNSQSGGNLPGWWKEIQRTVEKKSLNVRTHFRLLGETARKDRLLSCPTKQCLSSCLVTRFVLFSKNTAFACGGTDRSNSGIVTTVAFRHGLKQLGITMADADFAALLAVVDKDDSGAVDYREFSRQVQKSTDVQHTALLKLVCNLSVATLVLKSGCSRQVKSTDVFDAKEPADQLQQPPQWVTVGP